MFRGFVQNLNFQFEPVVRSFPGRGGGLPHISYIGEILPLIFLHNRSGEEQEETVSQSLLSVVLPS